MFPPYGSYGLVQMLVQWVLLSLCIVPLGRHMARLYQDKPTVLTPFLLPLERRICALAGVDAQKGMDWKTYALAALTFSAMGFILLYVLLVTQAAHPLNPGHLPGLSPAAAFNVTAGFITNTHMLLGASPGAMTTLSQAAGLTVQNFLSAAVGMSAFAAIARGITQRDRSTLGNFWLDVVRSCLYVLLPLSMAYAGAVATSGIAEVVQAHLWANPSGNGVLPDAGSVNLLVTHTGALLNANAVQFDDTASLTLRVLSFMSLVLIPAALSYAYGIIAKDWRQGAFVLAIVAVLTLPALVSRITDPLAIFTTAFAGGYAVVLYGLIAALVITPLFQSLSRSAVGARRLIRFDIVMAAVALLTPCLVAGACVGLMRYVDRHAFDAAGTTILYSALSLVLLFGRFWVMIPALAIAGSLSSRPS